MAIWNLGSINIDHVYRLDRLPGPGETLASTGHSLGLGGKGANQSIAAARAGAMTHHLGAIGAGDDWVIERLLDADGVLHLAWGALDLGDPAQPAMGVVHAMRPDAGDAVAEFSVGVVDAYHGLGIGRLLTATLLLDAAGGQLEAFRAHVLSENEAARSFIKRLGGQHVAQDGPQAEYRVEVAPALVRLREESRPGGLAAIFAHFDAREAAGDGV